MSDPFKLCPRYESCSCNLCPLDPDQDRREALPGEARCSARRKTREAIAALHPGVLPRGGLSAWEVARDARRAKWDALPAEERARRTAGLRAAPKFVTGRGSGAI